MPCLVSTHDDISLVYHFFRQPSMQMQNLMLKFPHLPEQIFQKLDTESLFKSREVSESWKNVIDGRNYPWLRIVNIPTILNNGNTYLHLAAKTGQIETYKKALVEEKDKNIRNECNQTSLMLACKHGRFQIVQFLLNNIDLEFDLNAKTKKGSTAFHIDLNAIDIYGKTGFHWTCSQGHTDIIKILMENAVVLGIDLNAKTKNGNTAFLLACHNGRSDVVKIFIENAADFSIDLNTTDDDGWTALHLACTMGHSDIIEILIDTAAISSIDLNANTINCCGSTCFHLACDNGDLDVVGILMENASTSAIDLNRIDDDGRTGFHLACERGDLDVVKMLMENASTFAIDLNRIDDDGRTGFHLACESGDGDVVKIFMQNAVDLNIDLNTIDNSGNSAFNLACERGHLDVMNMWYKFWRPDLIPKNGTEFSENLTALNRMISCQSIEPLTKIDYKCKLCKFETLETPDLVSHMVTGHEVNETQTNWNRYISLCKRVVTIPNDITNLNYN